MAVSMSGGTGRTWEFRLVFSLPGGGQDPAAWLDALFEAGCDDATVGVGRQGMIALDFSREAATADEAVGSAVRVIEGAIPGARLIEASPDLVNLADIADIIGCSRQNLRKYAAGEIRSVAARFPDPVHCGNPALWRLVEIVHWLHRNTELIPNNAVLDLARTTAMTNLAVQERRLHSGSD